MPQEDPFTIYEDSATAEDFNREVEIWVPHSTSDYDYGVHEYENDERDPAAVFSDDPIPSVEQDPYGSSKMASSPPPVPKHSSRRTSAITSTTTISSFPPSVMSEDGGPSPYTPLKERPAFRNPSSIRAMQMASPPPFSTFETYSSPRVARRREYLSSRGSTPMSKHRPHRSHLGISSSSFRSQSVLSERSHTVSHRSTPHDGMSPAEKRNYPLVLLHITLLPITRQWSADLVESVFPERILSDYRRLEEALTETVLARGVLISHPRDEYDMLEERLLESLELRKPRVGPCGHFWGEDADDAIDNADGGMEEGQRSGTATPCDCTDHAEEDQGRCEICRREMMVPGARRWDVRIYAANGLMRAGAWSAAWADMERVDAEIEPYIPPNVRADLDRLQAEENERLEAAKAKARAELEERREQEAFEKLFVEQELRKQNESLESKEMTAPDDHTEHIPIRAPVDTNVGQVPLAELLRSYVAYQVQDPRNILILMLGSIVFLLAIGAGSTQDAAQAQMMPAFEAVPPLQSIIEESETLSFVLSEFPETVTLTATMTSYITQTKEVYAVPTMAAQLEASEGPVETGYPPDGTTHLPLFVNTGMCARIM